MCKLYSSEDRQTRSRKIVPLLCLWGARECSGGQVGKLEGHFGGPPCIVDECVLHERTLSFISIVHSFGYIRLDPINFIILIIIIMIGRSNKLSIE